MSGDTPISDEYLLAIARSHPHSGSGPQLSVLGYWPLGERWEVLGKIGTFYWRDTMNAETHRDFEDNQKRSLDPPLGVGLNYHCGFKWTARSWPSDSSARTGYIKLW